MWVNFLRGSYIFAILIIHIFLIHFIQNKKVGDEILDLLNVPSHKVRIEDLEKSCPKVSGGKGQATLLDFDILIGNSVKHPTL